MFPPCPECHGLTLPVPEPQMTDHGLQGWLVLEYGETEAQGNGGTHSRTHANSADSSELRLPLSALWYPCTYESDLGLLALLFSLICHVTLGTLLSLSDPQLLCQKNGFTSVPL